MQRRMLAATFIGAFFLGMPGLLLFASGWRWSFESPDISSWLPTQKVSAIKLETVPRTTQFTVRNAYDEIVKSGTAPWTGIHIEPGYYAVTIEKEGYIPITVQKNLRPGQGWQPTHIVLPRRPSVVASEIVHPVSTPILPDRFMIEDNRYCYNWPHPHKHEWKRHCHTEPIIRIARVPGENRIWFHSEHWIGTHALALQYPSTTFSVHSIRTAGYDPKKYAYYGIVQNDGLQFTVWHTHPKPARVHTEPAPTCDYTWDFEQNGLFRKCGSETVYSEIVI